MFIVYVKKCIYDKQRLQIDVEIFENMRLRQLKNLDQHFISQDPDDDDPNRPVIFRSQLVRYQEGGETIYEINKRNQNKYTGIFTKNTKMIIVSRQDYEQQLSKLDNQIFIKQSRFLKEHQLFSQISNESFHQIFQNFKKLNKLPIRYLVYEQKVSKSNYFYIIKKG